MAHRLDDRRRRRSSDGGPRYIGGVYNIPTMRLGRGAGNLSTSASSPRLDVVMTAICYIAFELSGATPYFLPRPRFAALGLFAAFAPRQATSAIGRLTRQGLVQPFTLHGGRHCVDRRGSPGGCQSMGWDSGRVRQRGTEDSSQRGQGGPRHEHDQAFV